MDSPNFMPDSFEPNRQRAGFHEDAARHCVGCKYACERDALAGNEFESVARGAYQHVPCRSVEYEAEGLDSSHDEYDGGVDLQQDAFEGVNSNQIDESNENNEAEDQAPEPSYCRSLYFESLRIPNLKRVSSKVDPISEFPVFFKPRSYFILMRCWGMRTTYRCQCEV